MANALREILARFGIEVDTKPIDQGNKKVEGLIDKLGGLQNVLQSAFIIGGVRSFIKSIFDEGNALQETARRAGMSVEAYQSLEFAGEQLNVSIEKLGVGFKYLQRNIALAAGGNKQLGSTFDKLGISIEEGVPIDTEETFLKVADAIANIGDANMQTYYAMKVFGRGGYQLLSMLKEGSGKIREYYDKVKELGGGFTNAMGENVDALDDLWNEQKMAMRSVRAAILDVVIPALKIMSNGIIEATKVFVRFNTTGEAARVTFIAVLTAIGMALSPFFAKLALLAKPIAGLILMALLLEDIYVWFKGGESVLGRFFGAYNDGLQKSNAATFEALGMMMQSWENFSNGVTTAWLATTTGVLGGFLEIYNVFDETVAGLKGLWNEFVGSMSMPSWLESALQFGKGETENEMKAKAREEGQQRHVDLVKKYDDQPEVKAFGEALNKFKQNKRETEAGTKLAEQYGGKPSDYTSEGMKKGSMQKPGVQKWLREEGQKSPEAAANVQQWVKDTYGGAPVSQELMALMNLKPTAPTAERGGGAKALTKITNDSSSKVVNVNVKDISPAKAREIGKATLAGMQTKMDRSFPEDIDFESEE